MATADPLSILYVDDDADVRRVATLSLCIDSGIRVTAVESGAAALATIDDAGGGFDLFLFDVMMPGMSGLELMAAIAARPDTAHLPVVLMTARAQQSDIARYTAAGAAGIIIKPFDPGRLAQDVRDLHQRHHVRNE